jgi:hypothetical protein
MTSLLIFQTDRSLSSPIACLLIIFLIRYMVLPNQRCYCLLLLFTLLYVLFGTSKINCGSTTFWNWVLWFVFLRSYSLRCFCGSFAGCLFALLLILFYLVLLWLSFLGLGLMSKFERLFANCGSTTFSNNILSTKYHTR